MHDTVDFAELFTGEARRVVALAHERGLAFLFDYRGPLVEVRVDQRHVRQALHRLFCAAIDILEDGFVFFTAQVCALPGDHWGITIAAAASGSDVATSVRRRVLHRLALHGAHAVGDDNLDGPLQGRCAATGGFLKFMHDAKEGSLFSLEIELEGSQSRRDDDHGMLDAQGARAWLVGEGGGAVHSVERRLQRMGWATRILQDAEHAARELELMPAAYSRPSLVLAYESATLDLQRLRWLWALLPPATQVVLMVRPDSARLHEPPPADAAVEVRAYPLSPWELGEFTRRALDMPQQPSGETQPAPLGFEHRRRALVVDDNAVNQMVATGMLQVLGFEVDTANDGLEAIDRCMHVAPDLVLMDLHMPGMDGLEATRRLRLLQREGAIPAFPILAATADTTSESACEQAGMDGHLAKPLNLAGLENQLRRLLPPAAL